MQKKHKFPDGVFLNQDRWRWAWFLVVTFSLLGMVSWAKADDLDDETSRSPAAFIDDNRKDFDFSWLDPDKRVYVLQNRKYQKSGKVYLSLLGGIGAHDSYRNTYSIAPKLAFYFSEEWGIELFYTYSFNVENNAAQALNQASPGAQPVVREFQSQMGGLLHWAPWYAKINVFNSILYFDWYFEAGAGMLQANLFQLGNPAGNQNLLGVFLGTGHQFHLSQHWSIRLDVLATLYSAPIFGTTGDNAWFSAFNFNIGLGFRF